MRNHLVLSVVLSLAVLAAACGSDDTEPTADGPGGTTAGGGSGGGSGQSGEGTGGKATGGSGGGTAGSSGVGGSGGKAGGGQGGSGGGIGEPLAIPGALGFARHVRGAYAGSPSPTILIVDDLRSDAVQTGTNRGTLRWALEQDFPRVVVFEVSGYISLDTYARVTNDYVSIYGQTAPAQGITVTGDVIDLRANYILIQHLRFRSSLVTTEQVDSLTIFAGSNVFIDHCSFSYANDENIGAATGTFSGPLTLSNSIISQPLHGSTGKGMLIGGAIDQVSLIGNAFIHCAERQPLFQADTYSKVELINNMNYNPYYNVAAFGGGNAPAINFIGNVQKPGPNTQNPQYREVGWLRQGLHSDAKLYVMDNLCPVKQEGDEWSAIKNDTGLDSAHFAVPVPYDYGTPALPAAQLEAYLASQAGAFYWNRDGVDETAINDMVNGTGSQLESMPEAVFPALPEEVRPLSIPSDPHGDTNGDGYSNLEEWVQSFVP